MQMRKNEPFFTHDRSFFSVFLPLTLTVALQNLITHGVNLADNIMLGGYSEAALSGASLANQIQFLLLMLTGGIAEGVVVIGAQYWGRRDTASIKRILRLGLWLSFGVGLIFFLAVSLAPRACLSLFTSDAAVLAEGIRYVRIVCFTYLLFSVTNLLVGALKCVETVRIGLALSVSTLCINVCLNYCLIFGRFGLPRLGSAGAAVATLVSRAVELIILLVYLLHRDQKLRFRLRELLTPDFSFLPDLTRAGGPIFISNGIWGLAMAVQTAILGHLGASAIAANSIATTVFQIVSVISYGAAAAAGVTVGKAIGAGRQGELRQYCRTLQVLFLAVGVLEGLVLFFLRDPVLRLYAISGPSLELARQFMLVLCVTVVGTSYQMACLTGIVRGGGDTRFVMINDLLFMWGLVLPCSALAAFVCNAPPLWVFVILKSDQVLKCAVAVFKVNSYNWVRTLTR